VKNAKTVSDEHVNAVIEMIMSDSPYDSDPTEMLASINENVNSWVEYTNGGKDLSKFTKQNERVFEVPQPPPVVTNKVTTADPPVNETNEVKKDKKDKKVKKDKKKDKKVKKKKTEKTDENDDTTDYE
jgi:hypothetical protein